MIATRQRKQKKGSLLPILLPIAAIVMLIVALSWPPSRNFIANGPLHPVVATLDNVWSVISRPLTFDYQQREITDRNQRIRDLNDKLEADRKSTTDKDAEIQQLQKQIAAIQAQPEASPTPTSGPIAAAGAAGGAAGATGASAGPSSAPGDAAIRRTGQQWAAMDPEKAAALAQKLPDAYDAAVFAQMSPDSVGPIMDALPPEVAARIVQSTRTAQDPATANR
jgi:hypothetical protein